MDEMIKDKIIRPKGIRRTKIFRTEATTMLTLDDKLRYVIKYAQMWVRKDLSNELKKRLNVLQRKMVRYVYGWDPRRHVGTGILRGLGWMTIPDRVRFFAILHVFRIRKGLAPPYLCRGFVKISAVHNYQTRGSTFDYHISREDVPGGFSYFSKIQWNSLPVSLKTIDSEAVFRVKLKRFLTEEY